MENSVRLKPVLGGIYSPQTIMLHMEILNGTETNFHSILSSIGYVSKHVHDKCVTVENSEENCQKTSASS